MATKAKLIMILGVLVGIVEFLGLPLGLKRLIFIILGLACIGIGRLLLGKLKKIDGWQKEIHHETYTEHRI